MRRRSRPLIANHVQPRPARDQNVPGSPPSFSRIEIFTQGGESGARLVIQTISLIRCASIKAVSKGVRIIEVPLYVSVHVCIFEVVIVWGRGMREYTSESEFVCDGHS